MKYETYRTIADKHEISPFKTVTASRARHFVQALGTIASAELNLDIHHYLLTLGLPALNGDFATVCNVDGNTLLVGRNNKNEFYFNWLTSDFPEEDMKQFCKGAINMGLIPCLALLKLSQTSARPVILARAIILSKMTVRRLRLKVR